MLYPEILLSAFSSSSLLLVAAVFGLALLGFIVDVVAKKKAKNAPTETVVETEKEPIQEVEPVQEEVEQVTEPVVEEAVAQPIVDTAEDAVVEEPVVEPVQEETVVESVVEPVQEETQETQIDASGKGFNSNAYSRSYMSKLIQSEATTQERYSTIKNELLSYGKMRSSVAWTNETFRTGNDTIARIMLRGKTILLLLALDPQEFATTKYAGEDISDVKRYANTPMRLRVTSDRRLKYALELIALLVVRKEYPKNSYTAVEYKYEYQTDEQLIEAGLIKVE